jgi:hypothetical protein
MSLDVGSPSKALVSDAGDRGVTEKRSGAPRRGTLVLLCLIEAVWVGAFIYGLAQGVALI